MTEDIQPNHSPETLDQLQRLRVSVIAFQQEIAPLPASEQSNARNEQFNRLRLEAQTLLQSDGFDPRVPWASTEQLLAERAQQVGPSRLSVIVILGVILALFGLGVNSIILEDFLINSMGCVVSSLGMVLIIGAFVVAGTNNLRSRRLTNFGDLYQHCEILLHEINHALTMVIPDVTDRPAEYIPSIPSVVELALDSLTKQEADWQQKHRLLEEERLAQEPDIPMELTLNIDFVQRELKRVQQKMDQLRGRADVAPDSDMPEEPPVPVRPVNPP